MALSFMFAVLATRALVPAARGDFALLQTLNGITAVLVNVAVAKAIIHHTAKGLVPASEAGMSAVVLALASGALGTAVLLPVSLSFRETLLPGLVTPQIVIAVVLATAILLREYLAGAIVMLGRPLAHIGASALQPLTGVVILAAMILLGDASLAGVVAAWSLGILLSAVVAMVFVGLATTSWALPSWAHLRALTRFGVRTYPAFMVRFLNLRLDQFLVRILSSASVLGFYAVAVSVGELLIRIPNLILLAVSGEISSLDRRRSVELTAQFCRWTLLILAGGVTIIAALTPVTLPVVFGPRYQSAIPSVLLLLPGMVCYGPAVIISEYFIVQRGRPGKAALIAGVSLATSAVLNFPLTPAFGAAGASLASTASYFAMMVVAIGLFSRDADLPVRRLLVVSRSDLGALLASLRGR